MRAPLLATVLLAAATVAGCAAPVPSAQAECQGFAPTRAVYEGRYEPLDEGWEAQAFFEESGWTTSHDPRDQVPVPDTRFYAVRAAGEGSEVRARVTGGIGTPMTLRLEAASASVRSAEEARAAFGPDVGAFLEDFAMRFGAPLAPARYSGGTPCVG